MFRTGPLSDSASDAACLAGAPLPMQFAQELLTPLRHKAKRMSPKPPRTVRPMARPARASYMLGALAQRSKATELELMRDYANRLYQIVDTETRDLEREVKEERDEFRTPSPLPFPDLPPLFPSPGFQTPLFPTPGFQTPLYAGDDVFYGLGPPGSGADTVPNTWPDLVGDDADLEA